MLIDPETVSPEGCEKPLSQTCQEPGGWNDPIRQVCERPSKNSALLYALLHCHLFFCGVSIHVSAINA
jgi:hypothetical protein